MSLQGKVAVVTGGLSGIGRAIATRLADDGARIVLGDSAETSRDDGTPGDRLAAQLGDAVLVRGDVGEPADVDRLFDAAVSAFGSVDILINNAGVTAFKSLAELTVEDFDRVMRTNVRGSFLCARRAVAQMRRQEGRGVIVNVASNFAFVGATDAVAYSTSKGAVASMTQALAVEVGRDGIRVNALCPGATATEFNRLHRGRPEIAAEWERMTPLRLDGDRYLATPAEIADAAAFLADDTSRFMTGAALVVDGGWNAA
ncbi:SDR family NAD(P)-dependent oxidoreductase [Streptomyces sp. MI02-2A]|uniref:SDR family NAD(P)-dependent oxidoreductase n=1 Tax=unclassified Streptomyces TaxID=2593676 RepID=UPI000E381165|nr:MULTISPECIES: SDR family NAD(P)-dependent oxidoreductase [unclassified Streptomyces]MDX3262939.1 SDR family NAD(P)-dependent oxidoreductase [Streptomyces sp. MI02-2A]REE66276.1 2-deoxy-D-gluconate 3-dehydrogenase [Streptomyces sp. 3212.3]